MKLIFATQNQHKANEVNALFNNNIQIHSLLDIGYIEELSETGNTLQDNAHQKASAVFNDTGLNCFADDTGLMVDALNGAPGVYSARYAGPEKDFEANNKKLLSDLESFTDRKARFVTIICLMYNGNSYFFEGVLNGTINTEPRGEKGFGYDPIFMPDGFDRTLAELTLEEKNSISHRAKAFNAMKSFLEELL